MLFRIGLVAIVVSFLPWLAIAAAPLLGLSLGAAAGFVGVSLVIAEVLFWAGLTLVGKDTWRTATAHGWRGTPRELARLLVTGRPPASEDPTRRTPGDTGGSTPADPPGRPKQRDGHRGPCTAAVDQPADPSRSARR